MAIVDKKIEIKKSGSAMTSEIFQFVIMPNFRAIRQSVWEKNGTRQTETQKDRKTDRNTDTLEFYIYRCIKWFCIFYYLESVPCILIGLDPGIDGS